MHHLALSKFGIGLRRSFHHRRKKVRKIAKIVIGIISVTRIQFLEEKSDTKFQLFGIPSTSLKSEVHTIILETASLSLSKWQTTNANIRIGKESILYTDRQLIPKLETESHQIVPVVARFKPYATGRRFVGNSFSRR